VTFFLACVALAFDLSVCPNGLAQSPRGAGSGEKRTVKVELHLNTTSECPSNLLLLADLVSIKGSDALVQQLQNLPLAPAPRIGNDQTWTREDITKALALRGVSSEMISWHGAAECSVRRIDGERGVVAPTTKPNLSIQPATYKQPAKAIEQRVPQDTSQANKTIDKTIDKTQFTSAFTTPGSIAQAERTAVLAIQSFLQTKTSSTGNWNISVQVPTEHANIMMQRNRILGVAGGQPPWEGKQEFTFLLKGSNGEMSVIIPAIVKLPEMVVAANRPLAKGYVLREDDLVWIPMPRGLNYGPEDCFAQTDLLVGQQLRRAMSTQQVIRLNEVGPPTIIHVGDLVGIGVVSGGVTVETNGRAIESGAIDDLIQVEVQPHRKRVLARVIGDRTVEVISNGTAHSPQTTRTSSIGFQPVKK
jgi:flagella basal body P-ring formation protein FlgA